MALTINTQILGQTASSTFSYCYLYEPLRAVIKESNLTATRIFIDLEVINSVTGAVVETLVKYGEYDINPGNSLAIDLMKIVRQHHNADVYNYSSIDEIVENAVGWRSVISIHKYNFKIYSDTTTTPVVVRKIPILGGRLFKDFVASVTQAQVLTEADLFNVNLNNRWKGWPLVTNALVSPTITDSRPTINKVIASAGKTPCAGMLVWKSRFGGWMVWGFDIKNENTSSKYIGDLDSDMFESTAEINGNPFIPVDYTRLVASYSLSLKSLSLTTDELFAVSGILSSPAIYYMKASTGEIELMRLLSASAPRSSLANGGDFSVQLQSISKSEIYTK